VAAAAAAATTDRDPNLTCVLVRLSCPDEACWASHEAIERCVSRAVKKRRSFTMNMRLRSAQGHKRSARLLCRESVSVAKTMAAVVCLGLKGLSRLRGVQPSEP
jgi:hypothetical protein